MPCGQAEMCAETSVTEGRKEREKLCAISAAVIRQAVAGDDRIKRHGIE